MAPSFSKRLSIYLFFMLLSFLVLGLPLDSWWKAGMLLFSLTIGALSSASPTGRKLFMALLTCGVVIGLKSLLPLSYIDEGANVFMPNAKVLKQLPEPIYTHLEKSFTQLYPKYSIASDQKLYAFSVEQFHKKSHLSRKKTTLNFTSPHEARFGFMNKLNYNTYYDALPKREYLPFFVRYDITPELAQHKDTQLCWKGSLFIPSNTTVETQDSTVYKHLNAPTERCLSMAQYAESSTEPYTIYGTFVDPQYPLSLSLKLPLFQKILLGLELVLSILGALMILNFFYPLRNFYTQIKIHKDTFNKTVVMVGSIVFSIVVALLYRPDFASGFLLCWGGNDELSYASTARTVLEALFIGDWKTALQGGEAVFDLMPLHRYTYALNLFLFGETHFGYLTLICFFPLAIYALIKKLFQSSAWAFVLALLFGLTPAFEAFGFTQLYVVRLCMRGFTEPLSNLSFVVALTLGIPFLQQKLSQKEHPISSPLLKSFLVGLCFAIAVGARPNVIPGAGIFLLFMTYGFLTFRNTKVFFKHLTMLTLGFSLVLLMPLHNYYFGDVFVLFTIAGQKSANLAVQFHDYIAVFKGLLSFDVPQDSLNKITTHLTKEIKPTRPWLYLVILLNLYALISKKMPLPGKAIALSGLVQLSIVFFYNIGGRYGYLHWSLLLMSALLILYKLYRTRKTKGIK